MIFRVYVFFNHILMKSYSFWRTTKNNFNMHNCSASMFFQLYNLRFSLKSVENNLQIIYIDIFLRILNKKAIKLNKFFFFLEKIKRDSFTLKETIEILH